jgi:4a-hydroxytetrahydrobiopterin dehydratase
VLPCLITRRGGTAGRCGFAGVPDDNAVDPLGHGSTVWMQEVDQAKPLRHAMHVDVSVARERVEERVAAALTAGGRIVDDSNAPAGWILADRAGNRLCICVARRFHPSCRHGTRIIWT